jgi:YegS C-terminal NAD kinase beta sandwich-like domain
LAVTIRKGEAWGAVGALPAGAVTVRSDREARRVVEAARRAGDPVPPLVLLGGDLCRTMGGRGDEARLARGEGLVAPVDLGSVLLDGRQHWFVAHLVARRSWWSGRVVAAMNAEFLGRWDVAPRGHPNDGRLDVFDVRDSMPLRDRLAARKRLPTGGHLPHPAVEASRVPAVQVEFERPTPVWLDGERVGEARRLSVRLEPDALTCAV